MEKEMKAAEEKLNDKVNEELSAEELNQISSGGKPRGKNIESGWQKATSK